MKIMILLRIILLLTCALPGFSVAKDPLTDSIQPFRVLTNKFLDSVGISTVFPNVTVNNADPIQMIKQIALNYISYIVLLTIGALFFILFPWVGFVFCCCRCCCRKCGARAGTEKKNSRRWRIWFGLCLLVLTTIVLGGAILSVVSNDLLHRSIKLPTSNSTFENEPLNIITEVRGAAEDAVSYVKKMQTTVESLVQTQIDEVLRQFSELFNNGMNNVATTAVRNATDATQRVINNSIVIRSASNETMMIADQYRKVINVTRTVLGNVRLTCKTEERQSCETKIMELDQLLSADLERMEGNYSIPSQIIANMNESSLQLVINNAQLRFTEISMTMNESVNQQLNERKQHLTQSSEIQSLISSVREAVDIVITYGQLIVNTTGNMMGKTSGTADVISLVETIRYNTFLVLSLFIIFLVILIYVGLLFGAFGELPNEDASCCNKRVGGRCLMAMVGLSFISASLIMLIVMLLFVTGGPIQTELCRYTQGTYANTLKPIDDLVRRYTNSGAVGAIVGGCNINQSIIVGLGLENKVNGTAIYHNIFDPLIRSMNSDDSMSAMSASAMNLTMALNITLLYFNTSISQMNLTAVDPQDYVGRLETILNMTNGMSKDHISNLRTLIFNISLQQQNFSNQSNSLIPLVRNQLAPHIDSALNALSETNSTLVRGLMQKEFDQIRGDIRTLVDSTVQDLLNKLGECSALGASARRAIDAVCVVFLVPYNCYWCGMGWYLLFLIPCIIFAVKLNSLYCETKAGAPKRVETLAMANFSDGWDNHNDRGHQNRAYQTSIG